MKWLWKIWLDEHWPSRLRIARNAAQEKAMQLSYAVAYLRRENERLEEDVRLFASRWASFSLEAGGPPSIPSHIGLVYKISAELLATEDSARLGRHVAKTLGRALEAETLSRWMADTKKGGQ